MSRYKKFRSKYNRQWATSRYSSAKTRAISAYNKSGLNLSMPFMAGVAAAFVMPANPNIDMIGVAIATAPVKGFGKFKGAAQGYVFGQAMQHYILPRVGVNIPDLMNVNTLIGGGQSSSSTVI